VVGYDSVVDRITQAAVGLEVTGGARGVGGRRQGSRLCIDGEKAVNGLRVNLADEIGTGVCVGGRDDVDGGVASVVIEETGAHLGGESGVVCRDDQMLVSAEAKTGKVADANDDGEERRQTDSGEAESATSNLLKVFAAGNEEHLIHWLPPTVRMKISSSEGSTSSKR
jgi:hypothetical protein